MMSDIFYIGGALMAFREKSAWISLLATLGVYGVYFFFFGRALSEGRAFGMGGPISLAIVALVMVQVVLTIIVAAFSPRDARAPEDERERAIQTRANAGSFFALQVLAMGAAVMVYFGDKWIIANAIVFALAASQAVKYAAVIDGYRRGL